MQRVVDWLRDNRTLLWLTCALCLLRAAPLFSVEAIWPSLERFYAGTVAREMADGLKMPLLDYQFSSYEPGWLLAGLLCLHFMKLVGFTSFGMALAGILLDAIQFVIFYRILNRYINPRVALFYGLQYIIAPYILHVTNIFVNFSYFDLPFLTALFLGMYLKIFRDNGVHAVVGGTGFSLFCLGLLGGFSTWLCLAFLLIAVPCLVHWRVYVRRARPREVGAFLGGFLIGLSPLLLRWSTFAGGIQSGILERILAQDAGGFISRLIGFLAVRPAFAWSVFFQYIEILGVLLFVILIILRRKELGRAVSGLFGGRVGAPDDNGLPVIYIVYLLTFITVFCSSDFSNERYFQPVYPFLFGCNAMAVDGLMRMRSRVWGRIGTGVLTLQLLLAAADCATVPLYRTAPNLALFRDRAYSYALIGCLSSWRFRLDPRRVMAIYARLKSDEDRQAYMRGFGFELAVESDDTLADDYFQYLREHFPTDDGRRRAFRVGLLLGQGQRQYEGTALSEFYPTILQSVTREEVRRFVKEQVRLIGFEDDADRPALYAGLGQQFFAVAPDIGLPAAEVIPFIEEKYRGDFFQGRLLADRYRDQI